ncbi:MAG: c-type cytochrome [Gemmatimonadaceae bacterium]
MRAPRAILGITLLAACERSTARDLAERRAQAALSHVASSAAIPGRFGYGRAATSGEIQRIDIDVGPDGVGLPAGGGTATQGAAIFAAKCAACHGPNGEGTRIAAALVGRNPGDSFDFAVSQEKERTKTVGNYWPYATTLYDYINRAMPFDKPGSLAPDEVYSLVAFILARNSIITDSAAMNRTTLAAVRMPSRDRFVPDDREQSKRVR